MTPHRFPAKYVNEIVDLQIDFSGLLDSSESISSAAWSARNLATGAADNSVVQDGGGAISGAICSQRIIGGADGVIYELRCKITTSSGRVLIEAGRMGCRA